MNTSRCITFGLIALHVSCSSLERESTFSRTDPDTAVGKPSYQPMLVEAMPSLELVTSGAGTALEAMVGRQTQVADMMLALFKDSDINLLFDDTIENRTVSFDIKGATVEAAFEAMLRSLDLAYEWDGNFLRIRSKVRETFEIDLLGGDSGGGDSGGESSGGESSGGESGGGDDFWSELQSQLGQLVGEEDCRVLVNKTAGTVHVEGSPSSIERVREFVETTKRRATTQVSLEARILEVRLSDEFRLGINWELLPGLFETTKTGLASASGAIISTAASAGGGTAFRLGFLEGNDVSLVVDALESMGQVRVLSSPRVSTMNNIPASLSVLDRIPVIDREVIDSQGGLRTQFDIRFVDAGVSIDVTPQIGNDGMITVRVAPQITEQSGTITTPDGLQTEPILSTRQASTVVRVPDGQAIVIGGLRSTRKDESVSGVPFFSQIPLLGQLFHSTVQTRTEVELMVILVPRKLDNSWMDESVRRGAHRLVSLRRAFKPSSLGLDSFRLEDWNGGSLQGDPVTTTGPSLRVPVADPVAVEASGKATITRQGLAARLVERARLALEVGDQGRALHFLEQAVSLDPGATLPLVAAGIVACRDGQLARSRALLDRALALAGDDPVVLTARGILELQSGAPHAAKRLLTNAHTRVGNSWSANNLGAALLLLGEYEAARQLLLDAAGPEAPPELYANLAFAQHAIGDAPAAREALQRALGHGADPRNPRVHALRRIIGDTDAETASGDH